MVALMCDCCCDDDYIIIRDFSFSHSLCSPVLFELPRYDIAHPGCYILNFVFGSVDANGSIRYDAFNNIWYYSFLNDFYKRDSLFFNRFLNASYVPFDGLTQFFPFHSDLRSSTINFFFSNLPSEYRMVVYNHLCSFLPDINSMLDSYINYLRGLPNYPSMPTKYPNQFLGLIESYFIDNRRIIYNFVVNVRVCVHCSKTGKFKSFEILSLEIKDL